MPEPTVGIRYVPLSELRRWERNPKLHDIGAITASIRRHGFIDPIVVDQRSGRIVAGHGRDESLENLKRSGEPPPKRIQVRADGEWMVPILTGIEFEDDRDAEAYIVGSNRLVELGGWDEGLLQDIVSTEGFDALGTGLSLEMPDMAGLLDTSGLDPAPSPEDLQGQTGDPEAPEKGKYLRVGKYKVPLTDEERRALIARVEQYEEESGVLAGFWSRLLDL